VRGPIEWHLCGPFRIHSADLAFFNQATIFFYKKNRLYRWGKRLVQLPLKVDAHQKATLQSQIVEQIRLMILDGRLRSGDFLPTTRALSEQVGISRNTTMQAYERLMAEGYIQTRPYVGTFVSAEIPENAFCANVCTCEADAAEIRTAFSGPPLSPRLDALRAHGIVNPNADRLVADFWVGRPAPEAFPLKEWSNLVRRRLTRSGRALAEYRDPAGFIDLRQAIADHLGPTRGLTTDPDQIVIVGGTQDGLNLIARLLLESETPVVLESPCYQGAAYLFLKASGRISCPFRWTRAGSTSRSSRTSSAVSSTSRPPTSIRLASR